jgi:hypothetical protein
MLIINCRLMVRTKACGYMILNRLVLECTKWCYVIFLDRCIAGFYSCSLLPSLSVCRVWAPGSTRGHQLRLGDLAPLLAITSFYLALIRKDMWLVSVALAPCQWSKRLRHRFHIRTDTSVAKNRYLYVANLSDDLSIASLCKIWEESISLSS